MEWIFKTIKGQKGYCDWKPHLDLFPDQWHGPDARHLSMHLLFVDLWPPLPRLPTLLYACSCTFTSAAGSPLGIPFLIVGSPLWAERFREGLLSVFLSGDVVSFWWPWIFVAVHELPLVVVCRAIVSLWCAGFSMRWLLVAEHRL